MEDCIMSDRAVWISPSGKQIAADLNHITTVYEKPELFGLTKNKIDSVFKSHKEPINFEGKAREEVMLDLMKRGWIRCRYFDRDAEWHIQSWKFDKKNLENIWFWVYEMLKNKGKKPSGGFEKYAVGKYTPMKLMSISDGDMIEGSMEDVANGKYLVKESRKNKVRLIERLRRMNSR